MLETTAGGPTVTAMDMKPIFAIIFCIFIVIILEIVELTSDKTCKVEGAADGPVVPTASPTMPTASPTLSPTPGAGEGLIFKDPDTIVIGMDGGWPPYCSQEYVTDPDDERYSKLVPSGFIYEFIKEACDRGNLKCEFPLTGKWWQCWAGGESTASDESRGFNRNDRQDNAGTGLLSGQYDMCTCWVMTQARMGRVQFAINQERGYTKQTLAGLLTLKSKQDDTTEWNRLKLMWQGYADGCNGATMKQLADGIWYDDCSEEAAVAGDCGKTCPGGKVRIGYVEGWAMKRVSFDWAVNQYTNDPFGQDRIVWVDEHTHEGKTVTHTDYHHIARALELGHIDMAYTFSDAILAMQGDSCTICDDPNIWDDGGLTYHQTDIAFASGGVGTFMKYGQGKLAERLNVGVDKLIEDKEWYCTKCMEYWDTYDDCEKTCIGCGSDGNVGVGGTNYCASLI